jgi:GNAT superfamily N-acetyltransferase
VIERLSGGDRAATVAEGVLRALPAWFGLEEPLVGYIAEARRVPTFVAVDGGRDVGFLTLVRHTPVAVEIHAMGVLPDVHRRGFGRALVEAAAAEAVADGMRLLQVKTLGPSHPSKHYASTRSFYEALGFLPLEETTAYWGLDNPCLVMVRPLATLPAAASISRGPCGSRDASPAP